MSGCWLIQLITHFKFTHEFQIMFLYFLHYYKRKSSLTFEQKPYFKSLKEKRIVCKCLFQINNVKFTLMKAQGNGQCLSRCFLSMTSSWVSVLVRQICTDKESSFCPNCEWGEHIIMQFRLIFLACVFQFLMGLNVIFRLLLNFIYQVKWFWT